ncbi:ethylmalonyl-coa decarboxylase [Plakobranchus ocellatus]|uniref:Ethylmalonyl-CoA decarboxylase n=1 Tax=Plakobranchus ocellatus TaxID=259542 RepID=A0AAV4DVW0_9GAST|nr:ethylmalonyl-coa decarboxylase [Plakobranchus ocellatus]
MDLLKTIMVAVVSIVSSMFSTGVRLLRLPRSVALAARSLGSASATFNLPTIRQELEKFQGGSVELELDEQSGIAVMTLNNPKRLNALTGKMMVDMADHINSLERWTAGKGLVLVGTSGNFCSGGDLTFVRKALHYGEEMAAFQHNTLTRLLNLPLVSVALLQGHALGGGAELSTACDFRVMSSSARIGFVQIKMGVTTGWGATTRLVRLFGRQKALALLTSARVFSAEEAATEGLVDHVLSYALQHEEELAECKKWLASNYCCHDTDLSRAVKSSVVYSDLSRELVESLANERRVFGQFWGGPAQKAALDAKIKHK